VDCSRHCIERIGVVLSEDVDEGKMDEMNEKPRGYEHERGALDPLRMINHLRLGFYLRLSAAKPPQCFDYPRIIGYFIFGL